MENIVYTTINNNISNKDKKMLNYIQSKNIKNLRKCYWRFVGWRVATV